MKKSIILAGLLSLALYSCTSVGTQNGDDYFGYSNNSGKKEAAKAYDEAVARAEAERAQPVNVISESNNEQTPEENGEVAYYGNTSDNNGENHFYSSTPANVNVSYNYYASDYMYSRPVWVAPPRWRFYYPATPTVSICFGTYYDPWRDYGDWMYYNNPYDYYNYYYSNVYYPFCYNYPYVPYWNGYYHRPHYWMEPHYGHNDHYAPSHKDTRTTRNFGPSRGTYGTVPAGNNETSPYNRRAETSKSKVTNSPASGTSVSTPGNAPSRRGDSKPVNTGSTKVEPNRDSRRNSPSLPSPANNPGEDKKPKRRQDFNDIINYNEVKTNEPKLNTNESSRGFDAKPAKKSGQSGRNYFEENQSSRRSSGINSTSPGYDTKRGVNGIENGTSSRRSSVQSAPARREFTAPSRQESPRYEPARRENSGYTPSRESVKRSEPSRQAEPSRSSESSRSSEPNRRSR